MVSIFFKCLFFFLFGSLYFIQNTIKSYCNVSHVKDAVATNIFGSSNDASLYANDAFSVTYSVLIEGYIDYILHMYVEMVFDVKNLQCILY